MARACKGNDERAQENNFNQGALVKARDDTSTIKVELGQERQQQRTERIIMEQELELVRAINVGFKARRDKIVAGRRRQLRPKTEDDRAFAMERDCYRKEAHELRMHNNISNQEQITLRSEVDYAKIELQEQSQKTRNE